SDLHKAKAEKKMVAYGGEVPSEGDLEVSRQQRQVGWQLLRRAWIDGENVKQEAVEYAPGELVHVVYEKHVAGADLIADRLRREAERVSRAASLRAQIENLEETIAGMIPLEEALGTREIELVTNWQSEWEATQITPLSPKEMLNWLTDIDTLRFKLGEFLNKEGELADKEKVRALYKKTLLEELKSLGEDFEFLEREFSGCDLAPIMFFAESVLEDISQQKAEMVKLLERRSQARIVMREAQKKQEEAGDAKLVWQERWDKSLACLELKESLLPGEVLDLLETVGNCIEKLEKAKEFQSRIDGIDRDGEKFTADVQALLAQAAPELKVLSVDQAVLQLHTMLGRARQENELYKKNREEVEVLTLAVESAAKSLQSLDERMLELLVIARRDKPEELSQAIRESAEYLRLQEKISNAGSALAKVSEGVSIEELKLQAEEVDIDELPGQVISLKRQIDKELYPKIMDALKLVGEENRELQLMDGSGLAADVAVKMEQVAARIRRLVEHYSTLKLAMSVLKGEIERYRKEHQEPILKIASRLFSELTLNSFAGLRSDIDESGNPVLVGFRADDSRVSVAGMSDGTCDQLYLALRLATLQSRLENSEPMPFIVDDILVNFDDERSQATIKILAELAKKNQVILFTHHRQIVEVANRIDGQGLVQIHEL
ncbi:MAG: hypothetical protein DRP57_10295, partial [Spirochaetes bacterium]